MDTSTVAMTKRKGVVVISVYATLLGLLTFIVCFFSSFSAAAQGDRRLLFSYILFAFVGIVVVAAGRGLYRNRRWAAAVWLVISGLAALAPQWAMLASAEPKYRT